MKSSSDDRAEQRRRPRLPARDRAGRQRDRPGGPHIGRWCELFSGLAPTRQQDVLQEVAGYAMQAHITTADGRAGVARSGVKPTANPSVMICMEPPRYGFVGLPSAEHLKAFRVLVSVFAVADARRRETNCKGACGHAWHNLPAATEQP
ncbi:DUF5958 family protein [Streptomyces sp. NBC_00015]|uniref:DUF5958 family protein n=1 Tax=Streptomyces sp. NBC_00015 TaxID=2903611 RepID=UPI003863F970